MKITFFIASMRQGGAERVLSLLVNHLAQLGWSVTVIIVEPGLSYELDPNVDVRVLLSQDEVLQGGVVKKLIGRARLYWRVFRALRETGSSPVIPFGTLSAMYVIPMSRLLGRPVIVSEHTCHINGNVGAVKFTRRWIYKLASSVVLLTAWDKAHYYERFLKQSLVIPNPCSFECYAGGADREWVILAAGSVSRWEAKGFGDLILNFATLKEDFPQWSLRIAGGGEEECFDQLNKIIVDAGLEGRVELLGPVKDLRPVMQKVAVFSLNSKVEGFPMALLEAMSQGCACISYDCKTGPGELIEDGVNGLLVDDQNTDVMQQSLRNIMSDEAMRNRMGVAAVKSSEGYSVSEIGSIWIEEIERVKGAAS